MHVMKLFRVILQISMFLACCHACSAVSLGEWKRDMDYGKPVLLQQVVVTAVFPGCIYVQEADRSSGIRVDTTGSFEVGDVVDIEAPIEIDTNKERYIDCRFQTPQATGQKRAIQPLGMANRAFVGGDSGNFQKGIPGDDNLNTVGLLTRVWGKVSDFDYSSKPKWLTLTDGSGSKIKVVAPNGTALDADWTFMSATGVCSMETKGDQTIKVLKIRDKNDMTGYKSWVAAKLATMTLDEKIGQLFQVRFDGDTFTSAMQQTITGKHIGGIIYFQYNGNLDDPTRTAKFTNDLQAAAMRPDGSGIPLLLSLDQEGGRVIRITGGVEGPGNMGIGASRSTEAAFSMGSLFGREIRALGANMDLAPDLDVNNNSANPVIGVRSFAEQPDLVSTMGQAYVAGLHSANIIATGKHFPGHGDTNVDSHSGLPIIAGYDFTTFDAVHGRPFREALANGMDCIMSAHIVVNCIDSARPATLSPLVMQGYLRENIGFNGVVMTDSMGMAGITAGYSAGKAAVMAINAGVDLLSLSPDLNAAVAAVKAAALSGEIPMSRIDESVTRILKLKRKYGLFENPYVDVSAAADIIGCAAHRAEEYDVARASVTLARNKDNILPLNLDAGKKVLLVTVQSSGETTTDAAARFAGFITAKHANTASMSVVDNPNTTQRNTIRNAALSYDVVIIGTSRAHALSGQSALVSSISAAGKPVICVGMREPYELSALSTADAYLAIYNYRDCGFAAAADVIFGDYNPSAKLPVGIPGTSYNFGWGLSY